LKGRSRETPRPASPAVRPAGPCGGGVPQRHLRNSPGETCDLRAGAVSATAERGVVRLQDSQKNS